VPAISTGYNNTYQIFRRQGMSWILDENIHDARIVPLDRQHLSDSIRQWNGDSRGHWTERHWLSRRRTTATKRNCGSLVANTQSH